MTQLIATNHRWISTLMPRLGWFGGSTKRGMIEPAHLSDHLRRDIGLLDGNDPSGRHS
jgi:hypothetical protein